MAFSNIDATNIPLGLILQIAFSDGIRNQISTDFRDFEMVKRAKVSGSLPRELRFMFQTSLGAAAIQYANPGAGASRVFPNSQQVKIQENTAVMKELQATIELEYNVFDRARKSPERYGQPLEIEINSKMSAAKRRLAADLYGDGTGVVGTIGSAAVSGGVAVVTLSSSDTAKGHIGFFEYYDLLVHRVAAGTAGATPTFASGTFYAWQVIDKDRSANTVTLQGIDAAGVALTLNSWSPTAGEVFYRYQQPTGALSVLNLTTLTNYTSASEVMAGLESLTANDGRSVHGITMSGPTGGSRYNAGGNPLDVKHIQKMLDQVKLAVGQDRYRWKALHMAPESHASLIESRETDRRFQTIEDNKRGVKYFAYQHGNDTLECVTSEYVPQNRIYCLPETKAGEKVLEFHGSDFETVKGQDMSDFHLKVGASGYTNAMVSYLLSTGVFICQHPKSIGVIQGFVNT
jgi:hypothetical protein